MNTLHRFLLPLLALTLIASAGCGTRATHADAATTHEQGDAVDSAAILGTWRFDVDTTLSLLSAEARALSEASLAAAEVIMEMRPDGSVTITLTEDGEVESESGTFEAVNSAGDALTLVLTADDGAVMVITARVVADDELHVVAVDEPLAEVRVFRRAR